MNERTTVYSIVGVSTRGVVGGHHLLDLPQGVRRNETERALDIGLESNQMFVWVASPIHEQRRDEAVQGIQASTFRFCTVHHVVLTKFSSAHVRAKAKFVGVGFGDGEHQSAIHPRE
jgi:hypothetical protein